MYFNNQAPWQGMQPNSGVIYVPVQMPNTNTGTQANKPVSPRKMLRQALLFQKQWEEMQKSGADKDKDKDKKKVEEVSLGKVLHQLVWLIGLSVPTSAFYLWILFKAFGLRMVAG